MHDKTALQLFEELHTSLEEFTKNYRTDHPKLVDVETQSLKRLESITTELNYFLRDKVQVRNEEIGVEKFTLDKYETFILRIESVKPPEKIVEVHKDSGGFLGFGASETRKEVPVGLHGAMARLINNLTAKVAEAKAKAKAKAEKTFEKTVLLEEKKTPSETELRLAKLEQRMETAEKIAYEKGAKDKEEEIIRRVKRFLTGQQQQQIFLLLEGKGVEEAHVPSSTGAIVPFSLNSSTSSTSSAHIVSAGAPTAQTSSVFSSVFVKVSGIKEDTQEAKEVKKAVGEIKFEPLKALVGFYNFSRPLKAQDQPENKNEVIAKWLIFELMCCKYSSSIPTVFNSIEKQLLEKCGLNLQGLDSLLQVIFATYKAYSQDRNIEATQTLNAEECKAFHKLTGQSAIWLPKDTSAANYFGSQAAQLLGKEGAIVAKESYVENAVKKLNGSASAPQPIKLM